MELREFIKRTLEDVISGANDAGVIAEKAGGGVALTNNECRIEFDVSVSTSGTSETEKAAGIFVNPFRLGRKSKAGETLLSESRVKFSVSVSLPQHGTWST